MWCTVLVCCVKPWICTVNCIFILREQANNEAIERDDFLIKWRKNELNLNLHVHTQKQVLPILKHCLVR